MLQRYYFFDKNWFEIKNTVARNTVSCDKKKYLLAKQRFAPQKEKVHFA